MEKKSILINLNKGSVDKADEEASKAGVSRTEFIRSLVDEKLFDKRIETIDDTYLMEKVPERVLFQNPLKYGAFCHIIKHLINIEMLLKTLIKKMK